MTLKNYFKMYSYNFLAWLIYFLTLISIMMIEDMLLTESKIIGLIVFIAFCGAIIYFIYKQISILHGVYLHFRSYKLLMRYGLKPSLIYELNETPCGRLTVNIAREEYKDKKDANN